jgi:hypothetical protein
MKKKGKEKDRKNNEERIKKMDEATSIVFSAGETVQEETKMYCSEIFQAVPARPPNK